MHNAKDVAGDVRGEEDEGRWGLASLFGEEIGEEGGRARGGPLVHGAQMEGMT